MAATSCTFLNWNIDHSVSLSLMGNCFSTPYLYQPPDRDGSLDDKDTDDNEHDYNDNGDNDEDSDMLILDRLFSNESAQRNDKGTAASTEGRRDEQDSVEGETEQTDETQKTDGSTKVKFHLESIAEDDLNQIFSKESLLEKKRKSFSADMKIFAIVFEEPAKRDTEDIGGKDFK